MQPTTQGLSIARATPAAWLVALGVWNAAGLDSEFRQFTELGRFLTEEEALAHYRRVRDQIRTWILTLPQSLAAP